MDLKVGIIIFFLFGMCTANAQTAMRMRVNAENLYSTHGNHFRGVNLSGNWSISSVVELGLGAEFSSTNKHDDNGWNLYRLQFIPIYLSQRFYLKEMKTWTPYLQLQEGVSFVKYYKEFQDVLGIRHLIRETGLYGYIGGGTHYVLTKQSSLFAELGIKSFHISTNNLDVNPHGVTFKLGYQFSVVK